jgi:hypothetical protein
MNQKLYAILTSPRVIALALAMVFIGIKAFFPVLPFSQGDVIAAVVALIAFIASASVGNVPSYIDILSAPRFYILLVSLAFVFVHAYAPNFPITQDMLIELITAIGAVSVGTGYRKLNTNLDDPRNQ